MSTDEPRDTVKPGGAEATSATSDENPFSGFSVTVIVADPPLSGSNSEDDDLKVKVGGVPAQFKSAL